VMNSVDMLQKQLQGEAAAVEKEIESHNQQVEELTKRLEGLKRAAELFESEPAAMAELLQAGQANGLGIFRMAATPAAQSPAIATKTATVHGQPARGTRIGRTKTNAGRGTVAARRNGGLTRVNMIAAALRRHPRRTVRESIAVLDKEYHWKATESAVTGHLHLR
jgi:hypothetical protein